MPRPTTRNEPADVRSMPGPRHFLHFLCLYLRIRLGRLNLVVGSNSVSATTSVLSIGARYPATIRFVFFAFVIAQKRANTTERGYSDVAVILLTWLEYGKQGSRRQTESPRTTES